MIVFMNKADESKLAMIKYLSFHPEGCALESLAEYLTLSVRTAGRYFNSLTEDCAILFHSEDFILIKQAGMITLSVSDNLSYNYFIDRLHVMYTERSFEYTIIQTLLSKKFATINELSEELFISPSNLYRYLYKIEHIIQKFGMEFSFFDNQSDLNFIYEEKNIRFFSYFFYWSCIKGIHIPPFTYRKERIIQITDSLNLDDSQNWLPSKSAQISYLCYITSVRHKQKNHTIDLSTDVQEILTVFFEINDLSPLFLPFSTENESMTERLFFNLFIRLTISEMDSSKIKQEITDNLLPLDNSLTQYSYHLLKMISDTFNIHFTQEEYAHFFYYSLITFLLVDYLQINLPDEFREIQHRSIIDQQTTEYNEHILKQATLLFSDFKSKYPLPDGNERTVIGLIGIIIDSRKKSPLMIGIHYAKSIIGESVIQQKLTYMFNPENVKFTTDINKADLIISDSYAPTNDISHFFYLDSLTDSLRWEKLFDYVKKHLSEKAFLL
ncbi:helix-turn-helix domain-containing protein [uncultured Vagococcus sp.]|uniref:helix-turn-helix domain-containing protein n=1 Tax=uncultured Vagococcus sp. TaxID=189676 RepID=UPI0028D741A6|nr:helix-turn-helix domain-containing protein [uncultured Vagococcus sp.]